MLVLNCSKNDTERHDFYSKLPVSITNLNPNDLFVYLFSTNDVKHIRAFGKFLFDSLETCDFQEKRVVSSGQN